MGTRIGIIAGSGHFPLQAVEMAQSRGYACAVAGIRGEAVPELKKKADVFTWVRPAELAKLVTFFKSHNIRKAVLVGKVEPQILFQKDGRDEAFAQLLADIKDKRPIPVLGSFIAFLASQGIDVKNPMFLLKPYFCPEGVLTKTPPGLKVLEDVDFGWGPAKAIADLDIGQTIVVKDRAIVAVEGMEGTDAAIIRAGRLAGEGTVAVKVGRSSQDFRIDVPAVGLETMKSLVKVKASALAFEALKVPFFQKKEALALADANGIAVIAGKAKASKIGKHG